MGTTMIDLNVFNMARESFLNNKWDESILSLESMHGFDSSLIKEELSTGNGNSKLLNKLNESRSEELIGVFDCPYHPYLKLEYTRVQDVYPTIEMSRVFSNIRCVRHIESTVGIGNEQVVAIFPENFRSITANDHHPVFYFVDKFANRHFKYTRPLLTSLSIKEIFTPLISLSKEKVGELIANWVNIHESSHRLGVMPIPAYLIEKSNRYTAALEELRADLNTISQCFSRSPNEQTDEYLTGLYVLAERLLAYPLFREKSNFDAVSSVIMWKFLKEKGVFEGIVTLEKINEAISGLLLFIEQIEKVALAEETANMRKQKLRGLILSFIGNYDEQFLTYVKFWSIK